MIEFYDNNMSVCAQKVRVVLEAKGLDYRRVHLNLRAGDQFKPEYRKLNPKAVVPTLVDGGTPIVESTIIIGYIDDAYPDPPLAPEDPVGRAHMRQWMMLPDASLHDACGITSFSLAFRQQLLHMPPDAFKEFCARVPDPKRRHHIETVVKHGLDAPGVAEALRTYARALSSMILPLQSGQWLVGERWSLADATMLPYVLRASHLGLSWMWRNDPAVADWFELCRQRPEYDAIERHLEPSYLELMATIPERDLERAYSLAVTEDAS